jgi:tRNA(fMet)-specific endonuclease VapC
MSGLTRYLLDTNIISALARQPDGVIAKRIAQINPEQIATSIIVASEIHFGLAKSNSPRLIENVRQILDNLEILPLESPVDLHYADIRNTLERNGTPIGPNDLLIAAHARALDRVLVTDNTREFNRVPGLAVENWLISQDLPL